MTPRGAFITLEGIEGVGKSTNLAFVAAHLRASGLEVVVTREPGGTPLAERVRSLLLSHGDEHLPPLTELLLIFAARSAHLENLIRPQLAKGRWVICDRFTDATFAYQGGGRGLDPKLIDGLAGYAHGDLWPDLTLLLDAPLDVSEARRSQRGPADRIEGEGEDFFARVRQTYLDRHATAPHRIKLIDATQPIERVQQVVQNHLNEFLSKREIRYK